MNSRLFPNLQEITLDRVIELYGIEEVERVIKEDETAMRDDIVTVPGIMALKPFFTKKLQTLVDPIILSVVQGNHNQTEELIQPHPLLSSVKGEAIDYSI